MSQQGYVLFWHFSSFFYLQPIFASCAGHTGGRSTACSLASLGCFSKWHLQLLCGVHPVMLQCRKLCNMLSQRLFVQKHVVHALMCNAGNSAASTWLRSTWTPRAARPRQRTRRCCQGDDCCCCTRCICCSSTPTWNSRGTQHTCSHRYVCMKLCISNDMVHLQLHLLQQHHNMESRGHPAYLYELTQHCECPQWLGCHLRWRTAYVTPHLSMLHIVQLLLLLPRCTSRCCTSRSTRSARRRSATQTSAQHRCSHTYARQAAAAAAAVRRQQQQRQLAGRCRLCQLLKGCLMMLCRKEHAWALTGAADNDSLS
jgi:hypothetical protein